MYIDDHLQVTIIIQNLILYNINEFLSNIMKKIIIQKKNIYFKYLIKWCFMDLLELL